MNQPDTSEDRFAAFIEQFKDMLSFHLFKGLKVESKISYKNCWDIFVLAGEGDIKVAKFNFYMWENMTTTDDLVIVLSTDCARCGREDIIAGLSTLLNQNKIFLDISIPETPSSDDSILFRFRREG